MKEHLKKNPRSSFIVLFLVLIDLIGKLFASLYLRVVLNAGISWGLLGGYTGVVGVLLGVGLVLLILSFRNLGKAEMVLLLSGAVANLVDRVFNQGAVTDWILLPSTGLWFNIADIYLIMGVILAIIRELHKNDKLSHSNIRG